MVSRLVNHAGCGLPAEIRYYNYHELLETGTDHLECRLVRGGLSVCGYDENYAVLGSHRVLFEEAVKRREESNV